MIRIARKCLLKIDSRLFPRRFGFKRSGVRTGNLYLVNTHVTNAISLSGNCSKGGWVSRNPCLTKEEMQDGGVTEPSARERKEEW